MFNQAEIAYSNESEEFVYKSMFSREFTREFRNVSYDSWRKRKLKGWPRSANSSASLLTRVRCTSLLFTINDSRDALNSSTAISKDCLAAGAQRLRSSRVWRMIGRIVLRLRSSRFLKTEQRVCL